jgi:hypothetical protein
MEYTPEHMCHSNVTTTYRAVFVPIPARPAHIHSKQSETYIIWVANKSSVRRFNVSRSLYYKLSPGQKVTML